MPVMAVTAGGDGTWEMEPWLTWSLPSLLRVPSGKMQTLTPSVFSSVPTAFMDSMAFCLFVLSMKTVPLSQAIQPRGWRRRALLAMAIVPVLRVREQVMKSRVLEWLAT